MPISGTFWTVAELMDGLQISKQAVYNLAQRYNWDSPSPGLYYGGSADDHTTVDAYLHARARKTIKGQRSLDWDDTYDIDCPVDGCDGICLVWPDDDHYKCAYSHSGKFE